MKQDSKELFARVLDGTLRSGPREQEEQDGAAGYRSALQHLLTVTTARIATVVEHQWQVPGTLRLPVVPTVQRSHLSSTLHPATQPLGKAIAHGLEHATAVAHTSGITSARLYNYERRKLVLSDLAYSAGRLQRAALDAVLVLSAVTSDVDDAMMVWLEAQLADTSKDQADRDDLAVAFAEVLELKAELLMQPVGESSEVEEKAGEAAQEEVLNQAMQTLGDGRQVDDDTLERLTEFLAREPELSALEKKDRRATRGKGQRKR